MIKAQWRCDGRKERPSPSLARGHIAPEAPEAGFPGRFSLLGRGILATSRERLAEAPPRAAARGRAA